MNDSNIENIVSEVEIATADRSSLTERQKKIVAEKSLPTEIDKLNESQKLDIAVVEDALLYLDEKYDGVSFDLYSLRLAGIMGNQQVKFIPTGYDKDDSRNIVTVEKARNEHKYTDDYMLIPVRESMENVIKSYMEDYFGKGEVKIYLRPGSTDIEYGDVILLLKNPIDNRIFEERLLRRLQSALPIAVSYNPLRHLRRLNSDR